MSTTSRCGPWVLGDALGRGGQGSTFRARHVDDGTVAAVKRFRVADMRDWKRFELFEREAATLAALDHPAIPRFLGSGADADGVDRWIAMELVEGEPLARRLGVPLAPEALARLFAEALDVLSYLHGRAPPVLHRDIKPHNMILRADGRLALVDFGSVRTALAPEGSSTVIGTFGYLAPEQLHGAADTASDVYALGVTMVALATGIDGASLPRRGLRVDAERVLARFPDQALKSAWSAMVEPDPDKRPADVAAVRALMTPLAAPAPLPPQHASWPQPMTSDGRWRYPTWTPRGPLGRIVLMLFLVTMRLGLGVMTVFERAMPRMHRRQHERLARRYRKEGPRKQRALEALADRQESQRIRLGAAIDQVHAFRERLRADNRLPPASPQRRLPRGRGA